MQDSTKAAHPRVAVGTTLLKSGRNPGFAAWVPTATLVKGELAISLPPRPLTVLRWFKALKPLVTGDHRPSKDQQRCLREFLIGIGIGRKTAQILSHERTILEFKRIEEMVNAIIDNLLLFDARCFTAENSKIVKQLVRKVISTGCFSLEQTVKWWKQFTHWLFNWASDSETAEKLELDHNNFFRAMLALSPVKEMVAEFPLQGHGWPEKLAHLLTTRNMPPADERAQERALSKALRNWTTPACLDGDMTQEMFRYGKLVGEKTAGFIRKGEYNLSTSHISLATSACYERTVREGGRAAEIHHWFKEYILTAPEEDEVTQTILGEVTCPASVARWRAWFRKEVIDEIGNDDFGTPSGFSIMPDGEVKDSGLYGYDEVLGHQIVAVAYIYAEKHGYIRDGKLVVAPFVRSTVVPEPGFKARVVTTTEWWLHALCQSPAHLIQASLAAHPSARSGLERADQAWRFLGPASQLTGKRKPPPLSKVLVTDLETATDPIVKSGAKALLEGYLEGLTYIDHPLVRFAVHAVGHPRRYVEERSGYSCELTRGCLMGEPMTKSVLTILNLAAEERAIRTYEGRPFNQFQDKPWRCFAVAGDNQTAIGPVRYLRAIQQSLDDFGVIRSKTEDRISGSLVNMTEKLLLVKPLISNDGWTQQSVNASLEGYLSGPFIDSIKVRLLSPTGKSIELRNDRNIAIGKALSLGGTLKWLNDQIFPDSWVKMVRKRFLDRMGRRLPKPGQSLFYQVLMPRSLGGLDLALRDEEEALTRLPAITLHIIKRLAEPSDMESGLKKALRLLQALPSNSSYRGFDKSQTSQYSLLLDNLKVGERKLPAWEVFEKYRDICPPGQTVENLRTLRHYGWVSEDAAVDMANRGELWTEILTGSAKTHVFNTKPWKQRYKELWDFARDHLGLSKRGARRKPEVSLQDFKTAVKRIKVWYLYNVNYKGATASGMSLKEELTLGLPSLNVRMPLKRGPQVVIPEETPESVSQRVRKRPRRCAASPLT